ncbi:helix-turn-helix domain-containing protein [Paenibacillus sp.]|uniref:helix-turn-helix domain-containing protein n=1 Tax=Paenibacillus sp. TaxID=58172 RepID=UPI002D7142E2|nr:helix-turn-helix domain-containing protein [Paenibacillus sp.]HZG56946.1 helix-turn-helix domain-containing protein [Paenibacillus sp.]
MNEHLFKVEEETASPKAGVLLADRFRRPFGFQGHRSRGTDDWLLIYTVAGSGSFRVDREVRVCARGDAVLLSPGVPHHYASNEEGEWDILWVHFLPQADWKPWLALPRTAEGLIVAHVRNEEARRRIERAFERMIADSSVPDRPHRELAKLALAETLVLLNANHSEGGGAGVTDERVDAVLSYVSQRLDRKHRLSELAAVAGLSPTRLCHLMKEQTGDTITSALTKMRMAKAAKLLEYSTRRVNEIAADVGVDSPYYFTRLFTAHFGVSPSAYRKRTLGETESGE